MEMNSRVASKKGGRGRRKIPIERIANKEARQVCFSKRRQGLFKKAAELSILCGVDIAVVAFSPAGKPFTFGNPNVVDALIDRFQHPTVDLFPPASFNPPILGSLPEQYCDELGPIFDARPVINPTGPAEVPCWGAPVDDQVEIGEFVGRNEMAEVPWWGAPVDQVEIGEFIGRNETAEALRRDFISHIREMERMNACGVHGGQQSLGFLN